MTSTDAHETIRLSFISLWDEPSIKGHCSLWVGAEYVFIFALSKGGLGFWLFVMAGSVLVQHDPEP